MTELVSFASGLAAGMLFLWIVFLLIGRARANKGVGREAARQSEPLPPRPKNRTMWD